jgi:hypothetical protein
MVRTRPDGKIAQDEPALEGGCWVILPLNVK